MTKLNCYFMRKWDRLEFLYRNIALQMILILHLVLRVYESEETAVKFWVQVATGEVLVEDLQN
jgi:hypothetical protein